MSAGHDDPLTVKLLGPVTAWRGGSEIRLGTPRQRAVLAVLAARANEAVARGALIDAVWGHDPPDSAANGVHVYIGGLRRALEPDRARRERTGILLTTAVGYQLRLGLRQLDAWLFEDHLAAGRRARDAGDLAGSVKSLDDAIGLWIADPLTGVPGPWAEVERTRLSELRLSAYEERIDALLRLGNHTEATAQLAALVRGYPLRERFHQQWMLALYRSGRQAEALAAFADARRILAVELGIDPGAELRRLHEQILAADPALLTQAETTAVRRLPVVPAQLPADVSAFTGRTAELAELDRLLDPASGRPEHGSPAVVISAVCSSVGPLTKAGFTDTTCVIAPGDSGGPIFSYTGAGTVLGRGTITSGFLGTANCNGGTANGDNTVFYAEFLRPPNDPQTGYLNSLGGSAIISGNP
jgi:DNA-binding SARP family transcriptional activator